MVLLDASYRRPGRAAAAAAATWLLLLAPAAFAQFAGADTVYVGGLYSFSFTQTPFPIYNGTFSAEGEALGPDGTWDPGQTEAVGGGMVTTQEDSVLTAVLGVVDNGDGTYDGALAVLRTGGPLQSGNYPINIQTGTALFVFVDDAAGFALPDTLDGQSVIEWFQDLEAAHKFVSISGSIGIQTVDADTLAGTFSGTAADIDNPFFLINVTSGLLRLSGADVISAVPPLAASVAVTAAPNPFNPRTTLSFDLPRGQTIRAAVFDLRGRQVNLLHDGWLGAGTHGLVWDGGGEGSGRAGAGVYVYRVAGDGWLSSGKLVLVP